VNRIRRKHGYLIVLGAVVLLGLSAVPVSFAAEWSIGVYGGATPLELNPVAGVDSPVLTARHVGDVPARFVADPFVVFDGVTWHMFFEVLNDHTGQGDIGHATSDDGLSWRYDKIVLDEPHHLSYPCVFEWQGDYYMVPETYQLNSIVLYKAVEFPTVWAFEATLVSGRRYVDPTPFYHDGVWWMFSSVTTNNTLYLFHADSLHGPWSEHVRSPVVSDSVETARPGGRVLAFDGRLIRLGQDGSPYYGSAVRGFEIIRLSKSDYEEFEVPESPLVAASGDGWNAKGMHQIDARQLSSGVWLAAVDGQGDPYAEQDDVIGNGAWALTYADSEERVGENGAATNAFDGNPRTIWHTEWLAADPPHPHELQIDLGAHYEIEGLRLLGRQVGDNGRIREFELYTGEDGLHWGGPVFVGIAIDSPEEQEFLFGPVTGRHVRLVAIDAYDGDPWTSLAEFVLLGGLVMENGAPNGVIDTPPADVTIAVGQGVTFAATGTDPDEDPLLSYSWHFGEGSGIPVCTVEDPGFRRFDYAGTFTVTLTVSDAEGHIDPTPATRRVTVQSQAWGEIPQSGWRLLYTDSQELLGENGAATNAFDGNPLTIWHTEWWAADPPHPHELQIALGTCYELDSLGLLGRHKGDNGRIRDFELFVARDAQHWGDPAFVGRLADSSDWQQVWFGPATGCHVRLVVYSAWDGDPWTSLAELTLFGVPASDNDAPNGVIDAPSADVTIAPGESVAFAATGSDPDGDPDLTFHWHFGDDSGVADCWEEDPGPRRFDRAGTFLVTLTVADSEGLSDPTPASRRVTVAEHTWGEIPRHEWTLLYADSEELVGENGAAGNAFDGNVRTIWHTEWWAADPAHPHELQIDLGARYEIATLRLLGRHRGDNGRIRDFEFYVSDDGVAWVGPVFAGVLADTSAEQTVSFGPVTGRYVRLVALSAFDGDPWTSLAELYLTGSGPR
jgi:PKD repeat protein